MGNRVLIFTESELRLLSLSVDSHTRAIKTQLKQQPESVQTLLYNSTIELEKLQLYVDSKLQELEQPK